MSHWAKTLDQGKAPIYLLHGSESLLSHEAACWLKESLLEGVPKDFNFDKFDASESRFNVAQVINAASTAPVMSDRRVVWVQAVEILNLQAKSKIEELIQYIAQPEPDSCLILEARSKLDKTRSLWKALSKKSAPVHIKEHQEMKRGELSSWLQREAKGRGLRVEPQALQLIIESAEERLGEMRGHLSKLQLYISPRTDIYLKDVSELIPEANLQTTVWALLDALSLKKESDVLAMTHTLLDQGQSEQGLFALIVKRIRELLLAHSVKVKGGDEKMLSRCAGLPPFAAKKILKQIDRRECYTPTELMQAYEMLLIAEREMKSSKVPSSLLLEGLLLNLCLLGR